MKTDASPKRRWLRRILLVVGLVLLVLFVKFVAHQVMPRNFAGTGEALPLKLPHGTFQTLYYNSSDQPKGIVILGTGDGGWSYWEERVAKHLASKGYAVGGWDCRKFADTRSFDQAEVAAGFHAAVDAVAARANVSNVPIWYAGWSTGAEQAAASAAADPPTGLVGLLLAAPGEHGRYGITKSDLLGIEPSGPGSFALADLAPKYHGILVVQFAAGLDPLDDAKWLDHMTNTPRKVVKLPNCLHDMGGAGDEFLKQVDLAMAESLSEAKTGQ